MKPVLIIGYKRVLEFNKLLNSVLEGETKKVLVALDCVAGDTFFVYRSQFRKIIATARKQYPEVEIMVWERNSNLGSAVSVVSAIDWAFRSEKELIILEDDLVISPLLLKYFSKGLDLLSASDDYLMLSGTNPFSGRYHSKLSGGANYPIVWGWATNLEKWAEIRIGILRSHKINRRKLKSSTFSFLETGRIRAQSMAIDAWDVPLSAYMATTGKKCFIPKWNLVSNVGSGADATHTKKNDWPLNLVIDDISELDLLELNLNHPEILDYSSWVERWIYGIKVRNVLTFILLGFQRLLIRKLFDTTRLETALAKVEFPTKGQTS